MAKKDFLVDIDLNLNQLLQSLLENTTGLTSVATNVGRVAYDTVQQRIVYDTGSEILAVANLNDVAGLLDFKGGYDANTNTPDLTTSPNSILKGDYYVVTVAGSFFGEALEVGDSLFANIDNPVSLTDWTVVQGNVVYATETIAGVVQLATQVETDAGVDDTKAITPLKLNTWKTNKNIPTRFGVALDSADVNVTRVFAAGETTFTVTHSLGTKDINTSTYRVSNDDEVGASVQASTTNTAVFVFSGNVANNTFRVVIIG
jgi:hypothetical protein